MPHVPPAHTHTSGRDQGTLNEIQVVFLEIFALTPTWLFFKPKTKNVAVFLWCCTAGLEEVLVGSPGMAKHVLPMLLDKLSSEVSTAKEASLKALVAGVRAFGAPGMGVQLRPIGQAMFEEVRRLLLQGFHVKKIYMPWKSALVGF